MLPRVWVLLACVLEVGGDYFLKLWAEGGPRTSGWAGALLYGLSGFLWGLFLRTHTLQRGIIIFAALNVVLAIFVGHFAFGERLGPRGIAAALLALVAIILAEG